MLREMAAKEPAARNARPQQFVDLTFIKELDKSGFIDQMYKTPVVAKAPPAPEPQPVPASPKVTKTAAPAARTETVAKEEPQIPTVTETPLAAEAPKPAENTVTPTKAQASPPQRYTVKAGDTLSKLAEHFYNSIAKWETIYEANKDTLKNPNYIYIH